MTAFQITALDPDETEIGLIRKQWGGLFRDMLSSADVFTVNFPQDLDVKVKALFIAAMFLIVSILFLHGRTVSLIVFYFFTVSLYRITCITKIRKSVFKKL